MIDLAWGDKLRPLVQRDFTMRQVLIEKGTLNDSYDAGMEKIHLSNANKLILMIEKMGFPVLSNAGDEGVRLSWLIIQHSISLPPFIRESLLQMRMAAADKDYPLDLLAYTEDLVSFLEGRPQIYGTHLDWKEGQLVPGPIVDPEMVDLRRKSIGLPPLLEVLETVAHERPPKDPIQKAREFQQWRARVGWHF